MHLIDFDLDGDLDILIEDSQGNFSVNNNLGDSFGGSENLLVDGINYIVSGNEFFTLSRDGILKSAVSFDYESDARE